MVKIIRLAGTCIDVSTRDFILLLKDSLIVVFQVVMSCDLVGSYQCYRGCVGGNMFLQNFGNYLQDCVVSLFKRPLLTSSSP
jgi:hypothetical protein